ncbi:hypothetical protein SLEP1_g11952 [Rubroshorea leprosula]|nr:hypothetical protein SLEP1_g11952 [Rubroshorea leprosula]
MQKLGVMDLSHKLNSLLPPKRSRKNPSSTPSSSPLTLPGPLRRSSRLQNTVPVSYSEVGVAKKDGGGKLQEGTRPEVYTEEHEKLLGNAKRSWTLFEDGNRTYDPIKGNTCHQCRYGEHVLEAIENPNWISQLGFKSVAHYLIETKQAQTNIDQKNLENGDPVSARRSLSFLDMEAQLEESYKDDDSNHLEEEKEVLPADNKDGESNIRSESPSKLKKRPLAAEPWMDSIAGRLRQRQGEGKDHNMQALNNMLSENALEKKEEALHGDNQHGESSIGTKNSSKLEKKLAAASEPSADSAAGRVKAKITNIVKAVLRENNSKLKKRPVAAEPNADGIGERLRQRRREGNDHNKQELPVKI